MSVENIIGKWKSREYKPVYWFEGEEEFFIDELIHYAEHNLLNESEKGFNQTIFYGRDIAWTDVVNACSRYPMFAEKQLVIVKEAQHMRDVDKLEGYISHPLSTTILIIAYKGKTLDRRSRFTKVVEKSGEIYQAKKMFDNNLPSWAGGYVRSKGFEIAPGALMLLVDHIGNDPGRIANEVEKVLTNIKDRKDITADDIEQFVGISKDFNIFELQQAISNKDLAKAIQIIQYFEANPKAAPIQLLLPSLYNHFSKVITLFQLADKSEKAITPLFYRNPFAARQALRTMLNYSLSGVEKAILLLHEYNLRSVGIRNTGLSNASLLKEMTFKIIYQDLP